MLLPVSCIVEGLPAPPLTPGAVRGSGQMELLPVRLTPLCRHCAAAAARRLFDSVDQEPKSIAFSGVSGSPCSGGVWQQLPDVGSSRSTELLRRLAMPPCESDSSGQQTCRVDMALAVRHRLWFFSFH